MWWEVYVHFINPPLPTFYRFKLLSYICPSATSTPKRVDKRFPSVKQARSRFFTYPSHPFCHVIPLPRSLDRPLSPMYTAKSPRAGPKRVRTLFTPPSPFNVLLPFLSFVTRLKMVAGFKFYSKI